MQGNIKKGLVIFFLNAAQTQEELHEVFKVFKHDFKDEKLKQDMLGQYEKLKQVYHRCG